jgi:hypothetical protein
LPIYLSFESSDRANAAHWLQRLELRFPCYAQERQARSLFFEDTKAFRPMSHGTAGRYLGLLLRSLMPEADAVKYSFHSFRVGFASALLAASCPPATIQALARRSSAESLAIYARFNPADYAGWVSKALLQRIDSITTRRLLPLPIIDEFEIVASFATADWTFARIERRQGD